MDYILWTLSLTVGYALGYMMAPREVSKDVEALTEETNRLKEDIAYYKKLTKKLVDENKELRTPT